jgi:hypothetical protein
VQLLLHLGLPRDLIQTHAEKLVLCFLSLSPTAAEWAAFLRLLPRPLSYATLCHLLCRMADRTTAGMPKGAQPAWFAAVYAQFRATPHDGTAARDLYFFDALQALREHHVPDVELLAFVESIPAAQRRSLMNLYRKESFVDHRPLSLLPFYFAYSPPDAAAARSMMQRAAALVHYMGGPRERSALVYFTKLAQRLVSNQTHAGLVSEALVSIEC